MRALLDVLTRSVYQRKVLVFVLLIPVAGMKHTILPTIYPALNSDHSASLDSVPGLSPFPSALSHPHQGRDCLAALGQKKPMINGKEEHPVRLKKVIRTSSKVKILVPQIDLGYVSANWSEIRYVL